MSDWGGGFLCGAVFVGYSLMLYALGMKHALEKEIEKQEDTT